MISSKKWKFSWDAISFSRFYDEPTKNEDGEKVPNTEPNKNWKFSWDAIKLPRFWELTETEENLPNTKRWVKNVISNILGLFKKWKEWVPSNSEKLEGWEELIPSNPEEFLAFIVDKLNTRDIIKHTELTKRRKLFMDFVNFISKQNDDYFKFDSSNYDKLVKIITIFNTNGTFNNSSDLDRTREVEENMTKKIMKSAGLDKRLDVSHWFWVDDNRNPTNFSTDTNLRIKWDISCVDRYTFTREWKITKEEIELNHSVRDEEKIFIDHNKNEEI